MQQQRRHPICPPGILTLPPQIAARLLCHNFFTTQHLDKSTLRLTDRLNHTKVMVDLVERLSVLLEQEIYSYYTEDYLDPGYQQKLRDTDHQIHDLPSCLSATTTTSCINKVWREKICEWSYQVVDHFDFSREIVCISISYIDRYLSKRVVDKKHFQLLAMSSLYLAIKLFEQETVSMKAMIELSRGYFLVDHMVEMERSLLR